MSSGPRPLGGSGLSVGSIAWGMRRFDGELPATRALDDVVASGEVGAVGVSDFSAAQVAAPTKFLRAPLGRVLSWLGVG